MRITLEELRRIIREEVQRNMRWTAGLGGGNGASIRSHDGSEIRPDSLGDVEHDQEESYGKEEEDKPFAVRVDDRRRETGQANSAWGSGRGTPRHVV